MKTKIFAFIITIFLVIVLPILLTAYVPLRQDPPVCPSDRILVKTLTDSGVNEMALTPTRSDVQEVFKLSKPAKVTPHMERTSHEFKIYQMNCYIRSYTLTENSDYRLTIQGFDDTTTTIIAQIINPGCDQAKKSKFLQEFQSAYETFSQHALINHRASKGIYKLAGAILFEGVTGKDGTQQVITTIHPVTLLTKFK